MQIERLTQDCKAFLRGFLSFLANLSQPAVSNHIRDLERALGITLFEFGLSGSDTVLTLSRVELTTTKE